MQSSAHEVSFEWKHHRLFSTDSKDKVRALDLAMPGGP